MADGDVVLLENLRFNAGETAKTDEDRAEFADALAGLADAFVSDGFGVVHRKQASRLRRRHPAAVRDGRAGARPRSRCCAASPSARAARTRSSSAAPRWPTSSRVIDNLMGTADRLLIGGGMVFTFLAAQGHEVGTSLLRGRRGRGRARATSSGPSASGVEIVLPVDIVVGHGVLRRRRDTRSSRPTPSRPAGWASTSGPSPPRLFAEKLADARTVFWNGPMGAFEMAPFAAGTKAVAQALVDATAGGALTVVGGGDSAAAVRQLGFTDDQFGHISTGGGASLEYLEGKELPGIAVLTKEH